MLKKILLGALAPLAAAGLALGVQWGSAANAAPTTVTATTHVINRPDGGHGTPSVWAYDNLERTLTVTVAADQTGLPANTTRYTATITDKGSFSTVGGAGTPNQSLVPGAKIVHNGVKGSVNGTYALTVTAPSSDTLTGVVPAFENDSFAAPAVLSTSWPALAFATPASAVVSGGAYEWDYATACEHWADSSANGDGNSVSDGNITGKSCFTPLPHVYDVGTKYIAPTREQFSFRDTLSGEVKVVISGPGPIGGHTWWVPVHGGVLNTGVITGLTYHRDYTLLFTPVSGPHGHQVPGSRTVYTSFTA